MPNLRNCNTIFGSCLQPQNHFPTPANRWGNGLTLYVAFVSESTDSPAGAESWTSLGPPNLDAAPAPHTTDSGSWMARIEEAADARVEWRNSHDTNEHFHDRVACRELPRGQGRGSA